MTVSATTGSSVGSVPVVSTSDVPGGGVLRGGQGELDGIVVGVEPDEHVPVDPWIVRGRPGSRMPSPLR